jgi:N-acetylglucosamine kinase-like BadF-type ATPase
MISAARKALENSGLALSDVTQLCAGVAGAGDPQIASALETRLKKEFLNAQVTLASDLQLSLQATRESPSVVVLAGTGSAALGRDAKGNTARAGGMGPTIGDPGSAYETGRKAISIALQRHLSEHQFALGEQILASQQCSWSELANRARAHPTQMFPLIFREVAAAGEKGDPDARKLLRAAAEDLALLAAGVIGQLKLREDKFFLGRTGGVFVGSPFLAQEFERSIRETAPKGRVGPLPQSVAETAAQLACEAARSHLESKQP